MVVNVFISAVTSDNLSRKEAVAWINDHLKSHLTKVEEMSTGAAYCQLTHLLFRDGINLRKIKFNPRSEPDILSNWKVLTTSWKLLGIDKPVDVEKMKKGKFQDNMEFLQWFYKFFNANATEQIYDYDAVGARNGEDLPALKGRAGPPPAAPRPAAIIRPSTASPAVSAAPVAAKAAAPPPRAAAAPARKSPTTNDGAIAEAAAKREAELLAQLEAKHVDLTDMEQERDHYYTILRKVEDMLIGLKEGGELKVDVDAVLSVIYDGNGEGDADVEEHQNGAETVAAAAAVDLDDSETF